MSSMIDTWEVRAYRYASRSGRLRGESFLFDDDHATPHPIDYFVWTLTNDDRTILVDTGHDEVEARRRGQSVLRDPFAALVAGGVSLESISDIVITHLHYDHAGGLSHLPAARVHLQAAELAYATGPCMCHAALKQPFTVDHVVDAVRLVYAGAVDFHEGDAEIAPGVMLHRIGGHSRGLQVVRVRTRVGWLVLASDAAHYWENWMAKKLFPIVIEPEAMLAGFDTIGALVSRAEHCIPGHDPLVVRLFPEVGDDIFRLDVEPLGRLDARGRLA